MSTPNKSHNIISKSLKCKSIKFQSNINIKSKLLKAQKKDNSKALEVDNQSKLNLNLKKVRNMHKALGRSTQGIHVSNQRLNKDLYHHNSNVR